MAAQRVGRGTVAIVTGASARSDVDAGLVIPGAIETEIWEDEPPGFHRKEYPPALIEPRRHEVMAPALAFSDHGEAAPVGRATRHADAVSGGISRATNVT